MVHWKEIGKKYNELVRLLRDKGCIDKSEAMNLFTDDYVLKKIKKELEE